MALSKLRGKIRHKIPYFILGNYLAYFFCSLLGDVRLFTVYSAKILHGNSPSKFSGHGLNNLHRAPSTILSAYFNSYSKIGVKPSVK